MSNGPTEPRRVRGQVKTTSEQYEGECDAVLAALPAILAALDTKLQKPTNPSACPLDGCLIRRGEACPACQVRAAPRVCACGRVVRGQTDDPDARCWVCLRDARLAARRVCACGVAIRTEHDRCSRCRGQAKVKRLCACGKAIGTSADECFACRSRADAADEAAARKAAAGERPFRWVQRGGIMRPVFDEVA